MMKFIDEPRGVYGVEPICKGLQVAPSGYWPHAARRRCPEMRGARACRDEVRAPRIEALCRANLQVYGADKVWRPLDRDGARGARCPLERVHRQFKASRPQGLKTSRPQDLMSSGSAT